MSKIKLTGDTSGYIEISAPNVAANNTLELGGGTKILTNLDNVFTGVTTYSGNIDLNANLDLDDNNKILLGTGDDLQIYHNGSESIILDSGTGQLNIRTDLLRVNNTNDNETLATFANNGAVSLYYDNSKKLETTTTGATVTGTLVSGSVTSELDLTAISASISDTAVDIFVYDTRKDSDGGAWRKRTQHTSWYNETLGTATRGSRKEFPAVAVIITDSSYHIKIYDGDDPDMPLWMEFQDVSSGSGLIPSPSAKPDSIAALNGIIVFGNVAGSVNSGQAGLLKLDFIEDAAYRYMVSGSSNYSGRWIGGGLANRNTETPTTGSWDNSVGYLVNNVVNDVAMTVLPNAPIDDATGLPVPTIAVATDGGVSVIKDDGTVVDINRTSDDDVHHVDLDGDRVIMFMELGAIYVATIPSADQSGNPNSAWTVYGSYGGNTSGTDHPAVQAYGAGVDLVSMKDHTFATAGFNDSSDLYKGLSILSENLESSGNGMVAWIRSDFNTGYMHGDIKGAFLSDTDTTNITDANLVSNGDFSNGTTGWSGNASMSVSGGVLTLTSTSGNQRVSQGITVVPGKTYYFSGTTGGNASFYVSTNDVSSGSLTNVLPSTFTVPSGTTTLYVVLYVIGTSNTATFDNVVVKLADPDRSVNNQATNNGGKGLGVFGTVTKSAVATGAELVAYSGFADNDYLTQPYNSDLDFGTGDYYMSIWAKGGGSAQCLMIREHGTNDDDGAILLFQYNGKYAFYSRQNGTATWTAFLAANATYGNYWSHVMLVRRGGTMYGYVNGKLEGSASFAGDVSNNDAEIYIGRRNPSVDSTQEYSGSLALARIGGSAPSPEQIKKMYNDEKVLFQENAKCTLYGSSDAVTALGYDEDTELLHVGTSAGRSDFQGLRRINNTTTAVTTAISASDDLIAEQ